MQDMSNSPQMEITVAQVHEPKTCEEEAIFDRFVKAKIFQSHYKLQHPCFIYKNIRLDLSFLRQILNNLSHYVRKFLLHTSHLGTMTKNPVAMNACIQLANSLLISNCGGIYIGLKRSSLKLWTTLIIRLKTILLVNSSP